MDSELDRAGTAGHRRGPWLLVCGRTDVQVLDPTSQPTLTLVTCYPFEFIGHAPKRFIVPAELVEEGG